MKKFHLIWSWVMASSAIHALIPREIHRSENWSVIFKPIGASSLIENKLKWSWDSFSFPWGDCFFLQYLRLFLIWNAGSVRINPVETKWLQTLSRRPRSISSCPTWLQETSLFWVAAWSKKQAEGIYFSTQQIQDERWQMKNNAVYWPSNIKVSWIATKLGHHPSYLWFWRGQQWSGTLQGLSSSSH